MQDKRVKHTVNGRDRQVSYQADNRLHRRSGRKISQVAQSLSGASRLKIAMTTAMAVPPCRPLNNPLTAASPTEE